MTRAKFQLLTEMLAQSEHIPKGDTFGRAAIPPEKQEGVTISDRFNIAMSSVARCLRHVTRALAV